MPAPAKAVPRPQGQKVVRLDSLKNPQPRPLQQLRGQPPPKTVDRLRICTRPDCRSQNLEDENGHLTCITCGTILQQTNIVSDTIFVESAGGDSIRTGQTVGAGESRARNYDTTASHLTGGMSSLDVSLANGRIAIKAVAGHPLNIPLSIQDAAIEFYKLARMHHNFIQGRLIRSVAAVCLYAACRRDKGENNRWMLIDFADKCNVNVFDLSGTFKDLIRALFCDAQGLIQAPLEPVNIESLILRYAEQMNFGRMKQRIANEAVRIVQRMNRDWMVDGRRPAGVCGAALILAARMNNFRRVVREVVYTVKIGEATINKRLDEFQETESSGLTVEEFRTTDLPTEADPPAFKNKNKAKKKRVKKRKAQEIEEDDPTENESTQPGSATPANANGQLQTPASTQAQLDRESMPPPPLPLDPRLQTPSSSQASETPPAKRRRGRPPGKTKPPQEPSSQDLQVEAEIEADIEGLLGNQINVENAKQIHENPDVPGVPQAQQMTPDSSQALGTQVSSTQVDSSEQSSSTSPSLEDRLRGRSTTESGQPLSESQLLSQLTEHSASRSPSPSAPSSDPRQFITRDSTTQPLLDRIASTEEISDSEFPADDPELSSCILTPAETAVKERLWTHENSAYLRAQQARFLKQQLAEANGTARVVVRRKRKRRRMGDMSDREAGGQGGAQDAAEAVAGMMSKRAFSRKINYGILKKTFTPKGTPSGSQTGSRTGSEAPATTPNASPRTVVDPSTGEIRIEGPSPQVLDLDPGGSRDDAIEVEDGGESDDPEDYYDSADERGGDMEGEGEEEDMDMAGVNEVVNRLGYGRNGDEDDGG
ncbi:MAG: hypothetical protein Q9203_002835 [Teloschistes exilis]